MAEAFALTSCCRGARPYGGGRAASIAHSDVMLHALPLYHCAQLDVFLGPAIYVGATSIVTAKPAPDNLLPLIAKHKITSFFAPPTVWIALLRSPLFDNTEEGFITVVDRKKDMIKSGGENVASREVEEMIYRLPAVSEVAVTACPTPNGWKRWRR